MINQAAVSVRLATPEDIDQMINVHIRSFPGFFLTQMGPRFLKVLYRGFFSHSSGILLVAYDERNPGELLGFVVGTSEPKSFFSFLLKRQWFLFLLASLLPMLQKPLFVLSKLWSALFYRGEPLPDLPDAGLLSSLCVAPVFQGKGVGKILVTVFLDQMLSREVNAVYLTTDQGNNVKANQFYTQLGFVLAGTCKRPQGRILNRYLIKLTP